MHYFVTALREHPELAIFLTLAVGFAVGRIRIGSFDSNAVVGLPPALTSIVVSCV